MKLYFYLANSTKLKKQIYSFYLHKVSLKPIAYYLYYNSVDICQNLNSVVLEGY